MLGIVFMGGFMALLVIAELPVSEKVQGVLLFVWAVSVFVALIYLLRGERQHSSIPVTMEQVTLPAHLWYELSVVDEFFDADRIALEQDGFEWDNEDTPGTYRVI